MGRPAALTLGGEDLHLPLASRGLALVEVRRIYRPDTQRVPSTASPRSAAEVAQ